MNTVRGDVAATIGWLDTLSYYLLLVRWVPFSRATCNGGQWQDLMLHQISRRNEDTLSKEPG